MAIDQITNNRITALETAVNGQVKDLLVDIATRSNVILPLDGLTPVDGVIPSGNGKIYLLANQTNQAENGIYTITNLTPYTFSRVTTFQTYAQINNTRIQVRSGTEVDEFFLVKIAVPASSFVLNTTPIIVEDTSPTVANLSQTIINKADKVTTGLIAGDIATLDATGNLTDSTYSFETTLTGSTTKIASSFAVKDYVDSSTVGLLDDRGNWDASSNLFPTTGGSGVAGAVMKGDIWYINVAGNLNGELVQIGDSIRALEDNPLQDVSKWGVIQANVTYIPENQDNKSTDITLGGLTPSDILYPSQKATKDYADTKASSTLQDSKIYVGNALDVATAVSVSGDVTLTNTGSITINNDAVITDKILNNNVTNAKLSQSGAYTWKGNNTNATTNISDNVAGSLSEITSSILTVSGTNATLNNATITANLSDNNIYVGNTNNVPVGVAMSGDINIINTGATTIQPNVVDNAKLAQAPANTYKGNPTGVLANEQDVITKTAFNKDFETNASTFLQPSRTPSVGISDNVIRADAVMPIDNKKQNRIISVANQSEMLSIAENETSNILLDINNTRVYRQDEQTTYLLTGLPASNVSSWTRESGYPQWVATTVYANANIFIKRNDNLYRSKSAVPVNIDPETDTTEIYWELIGDATVSDIRSIASVVSGLKSTVNLSPKRATDTFRSTDGAFYSRSVRSENVVNYTAQDPVSFTFYTRTGAVTATLPTGLQTTFNSTFYDVGGVVTDLGANGNATVGVFYANPTTPNTFAFLIGQTLYTGGSAVTDATAEAEYTAIVIPTALQTWKEIGRLVYRRDLVSNSNFDDLTRYSWIPTSSKSSVTILQDGTTAQKGIVQLSNIFNGTSQTLATTEKALSDGLTLKADKIPNTLGIVNLPTGGAIGLASATVDIYEKFNVNQTTAGQTLSLPNPTNLTNRKIVYVENIGSASFTMHGVNIPSGNIAMYIFSGSSNTWASSTAKIGNYSTLNAVVGTDASGVLTPNSNTSFTANSVTFSNSALNNVYTFNVGGLNQTNNTSNVSTILNVQSPSNIRPTTIQLNGGSSFMVQSLYNAGGPVQNYRIYRNNSPILEFNNALTAQAVNVLATNDNSQNLATTAFTKSNLALKSDKIPNSLAIANLPTGGVIGLASATVDIYEKFDITQNTAGQTITLPAPTTATNEKIVYVANFGTVPFTIYGVSLAINTQISLIYDSVKGWLVASGGNSTIALTGDVTGTSSTGTIATTISNASVTGAKIALATITGSNMVNNTVSNTQLAQMPALTLKGNNTGATANALDLTGTQAMSLLAYSTQTINVDTALTTWQQTVYVDATAGAVAVTLPLVSLANSGQSIEFKRIDNTSNAVRILPNTGQTLDDQTSGGGIFLFNQYDAIVVRSNGGTASYIVSDNRQSSSTQGRGYLFARLGTAQTTNIATGDHIKFDTIVDSFGSSITLDTTTAYSNANASASIGRVTLKPGKYLVRSNVGRVSTSFIQIAVANSETGTTFSDGSLLYSANQPGSFTGSGVCEAIVNITSSTRIEIKLNGSSGTSAIAGEGYSLGPASTTLYIEQLSAPSNVVNTIDSKYCTWTSNQAFTSSPTTLIPTNAVGGNIAYNPLTGVFSLIAGKTYALSTNLQFYCAGTTAYVYFAWVDAVSNALIPNLTQGQTFAGLDNFAGSPIANANGIYTPTTNQTIKLQVFALGGSNFTTASVLGNLNGTAMSSVTITQIGSSAVGSLIGATSTTNGVQGVVPVPLAGQQNSVLRGDGTWGTIYTQQTITATTGTVSVWNSIVYIDATANSVLVTLPVVAFANSGQSIEFKRIDNTTNSVRIVANTGQTIDGQPTTGGVYLFSQYDAIAVRSNGVSSAFITSDNRQSVGISKNYLKITGVAQNVAVNSPIVFNNIENFSGNKITRSTTNTITLKGGDEYVITGAIGTFRSGSSGSNNVSFQFKNITNNTFIGSAGAMTGAVDTSSFGENYNGIAQATIKPTNDIDLQLIITSSNVNSASNASVNIGDTGGLVRNPWVYVEQLSTPANVVNTVDYISTGRINNQTLTVGSTIIMDVVYSGNISYNTTTGVYTLLAGKTYNVEAVVGHAGSSGFVAYKLVYDNGTDIPGASDGISASPTEVITSGDTSAKLTITPTVNVGIKLITISVGATGFAGPRSNVKITQIGSSATTSLIGATSTTAGISGITPGAGIGQQNYVLKGDGTWGTLTTSKSVAIASALTLSPTTYSGCRIEIGYDTNGSSGNLRIRSTTGATLTNVRITLQEEYNTANTQMQLLSTSLLTTFTTFSIGGGMQNNESTLARISFDDGVIYSVLIENRRDALINLYLSETSF